MIDFFPKDLRDELRDAQKLRHKKASRLRVQSGGQSIPILRHWPGGFALDAEAAPKLRGFVDICQGTKPLYRALIVASTEEDGELHFEFKRSMRIRDCAPLDFERSAHAPIAYLPRD